MTKYLCATALALFTIVVVESNANACGVIGCILEQVAPDSGVGEALDNANRDLGHPAEQVLDGVLDYYAPGAGEAARVYQNQNNDE